jgi:hypothetical protein
MSLLVDYDSSGDEGAGPAVGGGGSGDLGVDAPTIAAVGSFSRALVAAPLVAPRVRAPVSFFYYLRFFPSGYFCGCSCARLPSVLTARTIGCVHLVAPFLQGDPNAGMRIVHPGTKQVDYNPTYKELYAPAVCYHSAMPCSSRVVR